MKNADKFKTVFGLYATEVWSMSEGEFLKWLNSESTETEQPEIIRCKDCKYRDENWRRVSVKWLPCMNVRTGSNWYCGSAERGEQNG